MLKTAVERHHSQSLQCHGLLLIFSFIVSSVNALSLSLVKDTVLPVKGSSFGMSCILSVQFTSNGITLLRNGYTLVSCTSRSCSFVKGYTFMVNQTGVFMTISSLDRDSHEGSWTCTYADGPTNIISNNVYLYVYTLPTEIFVTQEPGENVDLSLISATFQCRTIGCSYPDPVIQWMYENHNFSTGVQTSTSDGCTSAEKIYTSTLFMQRNSTLSDNSDKTVIFSCRTDYPDPSINIRANATKSVRFAVRVTEAVMQQDNQNITETLIVTSAEPVTLTCVTGTSRPDPTIDWYLGFEKRGSGASLTINFTNIDNNETIYCQAYNTDSNNPASSKKSRLYVKVRVTEAVLQLYNQNITETLIVTSAEPVTLSCVTGTSRPAPTIDWYLGSQKRGSGASLTINFTNIDHNEMIYCQAYNTDPSKPVSSAKPRLIVQGPPHTVSKFSFTRFIENQIELQFEPGYNGSHVQTFVIEYKSTTDTDMAWKNSSVADLKETQIQLRNGICFVNVTQPSPGNYKYRMYSWNEKGRSPFSAEITVIFHEAQEQKRQAGPGIAGIAGGIGAAVVVIAAIIVVFVVMKRRNKPNGLSNNPVYDKSDNHPSPSTRIGAVGTEYAVVVRHKHHPKVVMEEDPKVEIYERCASQENVYENPTANVNSSGNNTYENPGDMAAKGPGVNRDGLLYADLKLGPPSTQDRKPVIHGLETQTEYAEIDYGKRGEPLPEGDKEKKNGGARKKNGTQMNIDE